MAAEDEIEKEKVPASKISVTMWCAVMGALTLAAGGLGVSFGLYLTSIAALTPPDAKKSADVPNHPLIENANVRDLPPIITNLDQTSDTWVRLQAAIVFDPATIEKPDVMAAEVASDILGFMQTVTVSQLSGSSGLQHLREDLNDRALVRSDGRIQELVIESLVVQ